MGKLIGVAALGFASGLLLSLCSENAGAAGFTREPDYKRATELVAQARIDWGYNRPSVIDWDTDPASAVAFAGSIAWASPIGKDRCQIGLAPSFWYASAAEQHRVIDHEFGHCLGLGHSLAYGDVMYSPPVVDHPSPADLARARDANPWGFRLILAEVGQ